MAAAASNQAAYTTGAQLQLTQPQGHTGQTVTVHVPLQTLQQHQQLGQATQMIQVQTAAATAAVAGQSLNSRIVFVP
ncbi:unnamed protein product [Protopolystoma xenopodis]|uniref:Uncharacterized protein n=1 Tax=Protopolystoma xenopodis TaxID=117903 RepID=A0A3S5BN54_9PLAT|nr:unnamed protein product [Protopolystoma xenopodis]